VREKVKSPALIVVGDVASYALAQDVLALRDFMPSQNGKRVE